METTLQFGAAGSPPPPRANAPYEPDDPVPFGQSVNLFRDAKTSATRHVFLSVPQNAVDGRHEAANVNWCGGDPPSTLEIDLLQPSELNAIRLWTYWDEERSYQYFIEMSEDSATWETVVDRRDNQTPSTREGKTFLFPTQRARYVRTTITGSSTENTSHIVEIEGYRLSDETFAELDARHRAWDAAPLGLQAGIGSKDVRYLPADVPNASMGRTWKVSGWRGERVAVPIVFWTAQPVDDLHLEWEPLRNDSGITLSAEAARARFVRCVLADGRLIPDVLDDATSLNMSERSVRSAWLSVDIPREVEPGTYRGRVVARARGGVQIEFACVIEVLEPTLPTPHDWKFHLDLWQNPYAVARYHHVKPWSPEHFSLMNPHLQMLADAGQKNLTVTIVNRPWGTQTYDPYGSMVRWILHRDGTWDYDFSKLDRYIEFAATCGLDRNIVCYSPLSWTHRVEYWDEETGEEVVRIAKPATPEYAGLWGPFLRALERHGREKGWIGRLYLGSDEVASSSLDALRALIEKEAPGLKLAMAGHNDPNLASIIDDWCVGILPDPVEASVAKYRAAKGRITTFYVCCAPERPNTFVASPPAEAEWLGIYAAAMHYDGFLRWAYDSWTEDPLYDTTHVTWPAGDCFLVYPNARSSIRFERLREGIQDWEKIRILREMGKKPNFAAKEELRALEKVLLQVRVPTLEHEPASVQVHRVCEAIERVARRVGQQPAAQ